MNVIFLQPGHRAQDVSDIDPDVALPYIFIEDQRQLHTAGNRCRDGGSGNPQRRKAKEAEDEDGVDYDIEDDGGRTVQSASKCPVGVLHNTQVHL